MAIRYRSSRRGVTVHLQSQMVSLHVHRRRSGVTASQQSYHLRKVKIMPTKGWYNVLLSTSCSKISTGPCLVPDKDGHYDAVIALR